MPEVERDKQLARMIYHHWMANMKSTLDLEEFSYRDKGRNDPRYKFFKKQLMANTYEKIRELFEEMHTLGLIQKTDYPEDIKDGYQETSSGGSGYLNSDRLNGWLKREQATRGA